MAQATVTLSTPAGYHRADDPMHLDVDMIDEVEFDADECLFSEALTAAGYHEAGNAEWTHYGTANGAKVWIAACDGRILYVAAVVQ